MLIKPSKYNFIYSIDSDTSVVFNSLTTGMIELNKELLHYLGVQQINTDDIPNEKKESILNLYNEKFLVKEDIDETLVVKHLYHHTQYEMGHLNITIAPTLNCNLKCLYCYESGIREKNKSLYMSDDIQKNIVIYIENIIKRNRDIKKVNVTWYGGEPLLFANIVKNLSEKLLYISNKYGIEYSSSMITNGTLINKNEIYSLVKESNINSFQITLDGDRKIHNSRRTKLDGSGTYDEIINSILTLHKDNRDVGVRINLDKNNCESVFKLIDHLAELNLKDLFIHLGHLRPYTEGCINTGIEYLTVKEFSEKHKILFSYLEKKGFKKTTEVYYPAMAKPCIACRKDSLVIDSLGNVYKCRTEIGEINKRIGNVCNEVHSDEEQMRKIEWMEWDPFAKKECLECKYLPLCFGGCGYCSKNIEGYEVCSEWKYYLNHYLDSIYRIVNSSSEQYKKGSIIDEN